MSTDTRYNGWINRETWVFNLHFGDDIQDHLIELASDGNYFTTASDADEIKSYLKAFSANYLEEIMDQLNGPMASFFSDLMGDHLVDHQEMAEHWIDDVLATLVENGISIGEDGSVIIQEALLAS